MKIILGTAQLGFNYGIANKNGIPNKKEIDELFSICKKNGIKYCDTALDYGNSHQIVKSRGFKIITKIKLNHIKKTKIDIEKLVKEFGSEELDTILIHNPSCILSQPKNWDILQYHKQNNHLKIGLSVYTPQEAEELIELKIIPDVIQIPYNIFDRKFDFILSDFKKFNIEVHARSLFLQGLLFLNLSEIPKNLGPLADPIKEFIDFCGNKSDEKIKNALHFVMHNQWIDKFIIGVEKPNQLSEILDCYNSYDGRIKNFDYNFNKIQKYLLNPSNW